MLPHLIQIGSFSMPTYGFLVALGFLAGLWITMRLAKNAGLPHEQVNNLAIYCVLAGMLGAKILMILFDFGEYWNHPSEIFSRNTLQSAGVYQGGFLLALLTAVLYMRHAGLPALKTCDVFAPGVAIGHAIGRLGCFAAGCCYGRECHLPWAVTFTNPDASTPLLNVPLHPTQLYESFLNLCIFAFLLWRIRKPHFVGEIFGLYLFFYSIMRFVVEFFRVHEQSTFAALSITQWICIGTLAAGIWILRRRTPTYALSA